MFLAQSAWMIFAGFMFALMAVFIKLVHAHHVALGAIIFARGLPSVFTITLWTWHNHHTLKTQHKWGHWWRCSLGVISMWCAFYAYSHLPLSTSTSLNYSSPLFLATWMIITTTVARSSLQISAIALGFIGVLFVLRPSITPDEWLAALIGLSSGVIASVAMIQVKNLGKQGEPVWRIVFYFSLTVIITGIIAMLFTGMGNITQQTILELVAVGVFGMFGQLSMTRAFSYGSTVLTAAFQYTAIVFATLFGWLFWSHIPDIIAWLGIILIIMAGILCAYGTYRESIRLLSK